MVKDDIVFSCVSVEMFHLVKDNVSQIENNLLKVKSFQDSIFSWWFNIGILFLFVGSFFFFIFKNYGVVKPEIKKINFEPRLWNNAVRNVPITEYGQIPQTEIGDGLSGFERRRSEENF